MPAPCSPPQSAQPRRKPPQLPSVTALHWEFGEAQTLPSQAWGLSLRPGPSPAQDIWKLAAQQAALPWSPRTPCLLMSSLINCQAGFNSSLSRCHKPCLFDRFHSGFVAFVPGDRAAAPRTVGRESPPGRGCGAGTALFLGQEGSKPFVWSSPCLIHGRRGEERGWGFCIFPPLASPPFPQDTALGDFPQLRGPLSLRAGRAARPSP